MRFKEPFYVISIKQFFVTKVHVIVQYWAGYPNLEAKDNLFLLQGH